MPRASCASKFGSASAVSARIHAPHSTQKSTPRPTRSRCTSRLLPVRALARADLALELAQELDVGAVDHRQELLLLPIVRGRRIQALHGAVERGHARLDRLLLHHAR